MIYKLLNLCQSKYSEKKSIQLYLAQANMKFLCPSYAKLQSGTNHRLPFGSSQFQNCKQAKKVDTFATLCKYLIIIPDFRIFIIF